MPLVRWPGIGWKRSPTAGSREARSDVLRIRSKQPTLPCWRHLRLGGSGLEGALRLLMRYDRALRDNTVIHSPRKRLPRPPFATRFPRTRKRHQGALRLLLRYDRALSDNTVIYSPRKRLPRPPFATRFPRTRKRHHRLAPPGASASLSPRKHLSRRLFAIRAPVPTLTKQAPCTATPTRRAPPPPRATWWSARRVRPSTWTLTRTALPTARPGCGRSHLWRQRHRAASTSCQEPCRKLAMRKP